MLEKEHPSVLRVTGVIVDSTLQLLSYDSDLPLNCVSFDKTYFGTDVVRSAVLYNNSPEAARFVMVLNDTAEGQLKVRWTDTDVCLVGLMQKVSETNVRI